tara:strand:+ start:531 stop:848 length:318 start_codon:yes stop_codon:yes gene_type:complete
VPSDSAQAFLVNSRLTSSTTFCAAISGKWQKLRAVRIGLEALTDFNSSAILQNNTAVLQCVVKESKTSHIGSLQFCSKSHFMKCPAKLQSRSVILQGKNLQIIDF